MAIETPDVRSRMSARRDHDFMELIAADLRMAVAMFDVLTMAAAVEGVESVTITFRAEGGDNITIGYGEQAEPAILKVETPSRCCEAGFFGEDHACRKQETEQPIGKPPHAGGPYNDQGVPL